MIFGDFLEYREIPGFFFTAILYSKLMVHGNVGFLVIWSWDLPWKKLGKGGGGGGGCPFWKNGLATAYQGF